MSRYFSFTFCSMMACCSATFAQCRLSAQYEEKTSRVFLNWNMINHPAKTTYVLSKSTDNKTWSEVVTDRMLRNYTEEDIFDYDDRVSREQTYFYRLNIIDANNKTIAFSNTVTIESAPDKASWVIYPNPVSDILNLSYEGNNKIGGVINVTVLDVTGKILIRFRAASTNRKLEIPVSQLRKGVYIVQVSILNEMAMNEKFVKQ